MVESRLREALTATRIARAIGAHNALGGQLVESAGFDAVWVSGLEVSAAAGVPDANILSMSEVVAAGASIAARTTVPVLADCDSGFGNSNNVEHLVEECERAGMAGICIEDKMFPKLNSFAGGRQNLESRETFAAKILAGTFARKSKDFLVVARTEALIAGAGMDEAVHRAYLYERAGADALLVHSKLKTPDEVVEFRRRYTGELPLILVPTTYYATSAAEFESLGFAMVIYANHLLRAAITAMRHVLQTIDERGSTESLEEEIATIQDIFRLQRLPEMLARREDFETRGKDLLAAENFRPPLTGDSGHPIVGR